MRWVMGFLIAIGLCSGLTGCGGSGVTDKPKLAPAAGIARFKGAPVADAVVTFYPEKGPAAQGKTDATGAFQVKFNGQLGAVVGKNKVTVIGVTQQGEIPPATGDAMKYAVTNTFSKKYTDPATTDLIVDIPEKGNTELVLDLTP